MKEILTSPKTTHCYKITFCFKKVEADIISASEQALQHTTIPFFSVLFLSFSLVFPAAKHKQRETIKPMHFKWIKRINQNLSNRFHSQRDQPAGTAPSGDELYENWPISLQNDVGELALLDLRDAAARHRSSAHRRASEPYLPLTPRPEQRRFRREGAFLGEGTARTGGRDETEIGIEFETIVSINDVVLVRGVCRGSKLNCVAK